MAEADRLAVLRNRHASLDSRIDKISRNPGHSDAEVSRLKRERLALKDQIHDLESTAA